MSQELLQQTLDLLSEIASTRTRDDDLPDGILTRIDALQALAQQEHFEEQPDGTVIPVDPSEKAQQEQPASVDAYVGAREDAAIWKKRALEAEELNRKFIAELNGPTYLGEPVKQEQPTQEPVGRFVKATYGDYGVLAWHPSYVAKIGDCLYTHPAPTQPAQKPDLWKT